MELLTKPDWQEAESRMRAWWEGEVIDRPVLLVRSPKSGISRAEWEAIPSPEGVPPSDIVDWFTNPERVVARDNRMVDATFCGGEAFPLAFPVSIRMVAITAAYVGCPYSLNPVSHTGWAKAIIDDWDARPPIEFDVDNEWWQISRKLLDASASVAKGRYYVGMPDLNAPGEMVALLRDTQRLAFDLIDDPAPILPAVDEANQAWYRYWQAANGVVQQWIDGYFYWMGIWSDVASTDLQCDFNALISPQMFDEYFLPGLEQQTRWIDRTIFHLDGPGAIPHLESLLSLPRLNGIQWVPGDGKAPMHQWLPLLRRIQTKGKSLVLACEPYEVEKLICGLEPEGLLISTVCDSEEEARDLLAHAPGWIRRRRWSVA
jgi:hypothetical protein